MGIFKLRGEHPVIYDLYKEIYSDHIVKDDEMRFTMRKDKTLNQKAWYITSRLGMVSFNENGKMFFSKKITNTFPADAMCPPFYGWPNRQTAECVVPLRTNATTNEAFFETDFNKLEKFANLH